MVTQRKRRQQKRLVLGPAATAGNWSFTIRETGCTHLGISPPKDEGTGVLLHQLLSVFFGGVGLMKVEFPGISSLHSPDVSSGTRQVLTVELSKQSYIIEKIRAPVVSESIPK